MLKAYAIRKKGTDLYLPTVKRALSYAELEKDGGKFGPRLTTNPRAARAILTSWLQGYHEVHYQTESDWESGRSDVYACGTVAVPVPTRIKAEMEIVEFTLSEIPPC